MYEWFIILIGTIENGWHTRDGHQRTGSTSEPI
jgi:hypothetical protein